MDFSVSEDQRQLCDQIVRFAQNELTPGAEGRDARHEFPHDLWLKCGEMGLQGLPVPQDYGGAGFDTLTTVMALEALGYGCEDAGLVFSICAHMLACVVPIWLHGSAEQKERYLPDLCSGRRIAVNAMTESEGGSDAFNMRTRATPDGDGFVIRGAKVFGSNAPVADLAVVYAATDSKKGFMGGVTGFLVEHGTTGFSRGQSFKKMGLRTSPIGELVFDDVRVDETAILGRVGGGGPIFAQSMDWERICLVAAHVGHMRRLLERVVDYARTRKSFGKRLGEYQAVSHKIADMKVRLEASRLLVYHAASKLGEGRGAGLDAAVTKLFVSEAVVETAQEALHLFGGNGYMVDYGLERSLRDVIAAPIYSGTSEMQRNIIASWLGV